MLHDSILDLIGDTPMVRINHLNPNPDVKLYIKLEKFNPRYSVKDRIAKYMIENAERDGLLSHEHTIIEPTSGNTGIGLALVAAVKGYKLELVMPENMTEERKKTLIAHGARLTLSPAEQGMNGAEDLAHKIVRENPDKYFMPNQFVNKYNPLAHYEGTGAEIWKDTAGKISHFVAGIGTSGTLMGVSKYLKGHNSKVLVIAVEPHKDTPIPGLKNLEVQYVPDIFDPAVIDERHYVKLETAEEMCRLLSLREGIFVGPSSGAVFHIAVERAKELEKGVMVALLADSGDRYLSTKLGDIELYIECAKKYGIKCALVTD